MTEADKPKAWSDWYRFARQEFGYQHDESVEYANLRFVEDQPDPGRERRHARRNRHIDGNITVAGEVENPRPPS
jgi:hypothetical protein